MLAHDSSLYTKEPWEEAAALSLSLHKEPWREAAALSLPLHKGAAFKPPLFDKGEVAPQASPLCKGEEVPQAAPLV